MRVILGPHELGRRAMQVRHGNGVEFVVSRHTNKVQSLTLIQSSVGLVIRRTCYRCEWILIFPSTAKTRRVPEPHHTCTPRYRRRPQS
jgi:hypothetical protein